MRIFVLCLLVVCAVPMGHAKASPIAADPESILAALRSPEKDQRLAALDAITDIPGYPRTAEDLLPALLWMADGDDPDVAVPAHKQAVALGWPNVYCLPCIKRLGSREDVIYKMMALSLLVKLAWEDPGAMAILLEINRNHSPGNGTMIRAYDSLLKELSCGTDADVDNWNSRSGRYHDRMVDALQGGGKRMKPIAEALLRCSKLDPTLAAAAQAVVDSVPDAP